VHFKDLDYLIAVAHSANLSQAAESLSVSQPSLTKAIRRIESDVGMRLFARSAKGMLLTAAGKVFLQRASKMSIDYTDALREMQLMRTGELGVLRLGFSPTVNKRVVLQTCRRLLIERPAACFQLREKLSGELLGMLRAGELDLILAPLPEGENTDTTFRPLYGDSLHIIAARDHPLRGRPDLRLEHLAQAEWMLPPRDTKVRRRIDSLFRQHGLSDPKIRIETDFGSPSIYQIIEGTALLSLCGDESLAWLESTGLKSLPVADLGFKRTIGILYRPDAYLSPLVLRIIEMFTESTINMHARKL